MSGLVYQATLIDTNKSYIGSTSVSLETRKIQHIACSKIDTKNKFHLALKKYGYHKFIWTILYLCDDIKKLRMEEGRYIRKFKTTDDCYGFNTVKYGIGRIPIAKKPTVIISLKISTELYDCIEIRAQKEQRSLAQMIRLLLIEGIRL